MSSRTRAVIELKQARFASDVAVQGTAKYVGPSQELRAKVSVDGPGVLDGTLRMSGVWFGFGVETTVLVVRGTLGGRHVSLTGARILTHRNWLRTSTVDTVNHIFQR